MGGGEERACRLMRLRPKQGAHTGVSFAHRGAEVTGIAVAGIAESSRGAVDVSSILLTDPPLATKQSYAAQEGRA